MKLSRNSIEGTDVEITNFFKNNGFDAGQYFNLSALQIPRFRWIIIPSILFIVLSISICFTSRFVDFLIPQVIVSLVFGFWAIISIHLRFRNWFISSGAFLILILILGLATKEYSISNVLKQLNAAQGKVKNQ